MILDVHTFQYTLSIVFFFWRVEVPVQHWLVSELPEPRKRQGSSEWRSGQVQSCRLPRPRVAPAAI